MRTRTLGLYFGLLAFLVCQLNCVATDVLIETPGTLSASATRPIVSGGLLGHAGEIRVGGTPVILTRIAVYGQVLKTTRVAWVIYRDISDSLPVMQSSPRFLEPTSAPSWLESPSFGPFTLEANTTYFLGFVAEEGTFDSIQFFYNGNGIPLSQNGLTLPTEPIPRAGNTYGTLSSPRIIMNSSAQLGMRLRIAPALTAPAGASVYSDLVPVSFYLPTTASPGSLKIDFSDGLQTRTLTLAGGLETPGTHSFSFPSSNPEASSAIVDGEAIPDGDYTVTLSYQDISGAPVSDAVANVKIDRTPPSFSANSQAAAYTESANPISIVTNPFVSDAAWVGGKLDVQIVTNATPSDQLSLYGIAGLTINGSNVIDDGVIFATANTIGGAVTGSNLLRFTFNSHATDDRIRRLITVLAFSNSSQNPGAESRTVRITVVDSVGLATPLETAVKVMPENDAPQITTSFMTPVFREGDGVAGTPVSVDAKVTVSDVDNTTLASATVSITNGLVRSEDVLALAAGSVDVGNIVGSYDAATGVLTLTSEGATATVGQWCSALQSITYSNSSELPLGLNRIASIVVNDGATNSAPVNKTIEVIPINDRPVALGQQVILKEDTATNLTLAGTDSDSPTLTYAVVTPPSHGTLSGAPPLLTYAPASGFHGEDSFTFSANDGYNSSSTAATVAIHVDSVNDNPTLSALPDIEVLENWGATVVVPLSGISTGADNEAQTLSVTASSSKPDLIPNPGIAYTTPDSTGALTFKPLANTNGEATIFVTVNDGGEEFATVTRSFVVTVLPVNSTPTFKRGADLSVGRNAGAQVIPSWATQIQAGPSDEATQELSFTVTAQRPELFAQQPSLAPNGTLTFTPSPTASGTTAVNVVLRDNGGTASGGIDMSSVQTFEISVTTVAEELGRYVGLVQSEPGQDAAHERSGLFNLHVQRLGYFTGSLRLGGEAFPLHGRFDEQGVARFGKSSAPSLNLAPKAPLLALSLKIDVADGTDKLSGAITSGGEPFSTMDGDRIIFSAAKSPVWPYRPVPRELVGRYTTVFDPPVPQSGAKKIYPLGSGPGAITVSRNGVARLVARLADGTTVSYANYLSKDRTWPVHFLAYSKRGSVTGRVAFEDIPNVGDLRGQLHWFRPANASSAAYPGGWPEGIATQLVGAKFTLPSAPQPPTAFPGLASATSTGNAELQLNSTTFPSISQRLNIYPDNRIAFVLPRQQDLQLKIKPSGLFTGSFIAPKGGHRTQMWGAILQKQTRAAGYFLSHEDAGAVTIVPVAK